MSDIFDGPSITELRERRIIELEAVNLRLQTKIERQRAVIEAAREFVNRCNRDSVEDYDWAMSHGFGQLADALRALDGKPPRIKVDKASASEIMETICGGGDE